MQHKSLPPQQQRIGFHYFSDFDHFRESDLTKWLPELQALGTAWLTLYAPYDHAIPEPFIIGLKKANIEPIIHFHSTTSQSPNISTIKALLNVYANWGVHYIVFFDRPNQRSEWLPSEWAQGKLVERFLDRYLPFAEATLSQGLLPVLPPLKPGGDYWDTAFLKDLLLAMIRRGYSSLLDNAVISAYARTGNRPLNWGAGGPERWPSTRPYFTPEGSQDQCGFRIFDWYFAICNAVKGKTLPIILFGAGCHVGDNSDPRYSKVTPESHALCHLEIARSLASEDNKLELIPQEVVACNFSPLLTTPGSQVASHAWFQVDGNTLPVVNTLQNWVRSQSLITISKETSAKSGQPNSHPIAHYLLLTEDTWGRSRKKSLILRQFLQKYKPTIGYSPREASFARHVTIFGNAQAFPTKVVVQLIEAGCVVDHIQEDGTVLALNSTVY